MRLPIGRKRQKSASVYKDGNQTRSSNRLAPKKENPAGGTDGVHTTRAEYPDFDPFGENSALSEENLLV